MASLQHRQFDRRAQRVRTKLRKVAAGKARLSVTRSTKHISVQLIDDAKGDMDAKRRQETIIKAMKFHHDNVLHIPLHLQVIPWASRANVEVVHRADNWLQATWVKIR